MPEDTTAKPKLPARNEKKDSTFKKYYLKYRTRIYWYVYRKISRQEKSEDITADVFLKLYEHIDDISKRGDSGVISWLYTVARNSSIDHLRKQGSRKVYTMNDEEIDTVAKVYENFVEEAMREEEIAEIHKALHTSDDLSLEIMQLRYEEGMKFHEIADIIGKSEGACKMILYRNLEKVRDELLNSRKNNKGSNESKNPTKTK